MIKDYNACKIDGYLNNGEQRVLILIITNVGDLIIELKPLVMTTKEFVQIENLGISEEGSTLLNHHEPGVAWTRPSRIPKPPSLTKDYEMD